MPETSCNMVQSKDLFTVKEVGCILSLELGDFCHASFFCWILPLNRIISRNPIWTSDMVPTECTRILSEVSSRFRGDSPNESPSTVRGEIV